MNEIINVEGEYFSTYAFVSGNNLEVIAEEVLGKNWEAEDDVNQILAIIEHMNIGKYSVECNEYDTREDDIIVTKIDDTILDSQEIKTALESIRAKIYRNEMSAWNADLQNTTSAIAIEDHFGNAGSDPEKDEPSTIYNGWLSDLESLISKLQQL